MVNTTEEFVCGVILSSVVLLGLSVVSNTPHLILLTQFLVIAVVLASLEERGMCACICVYVVLSSGLAYV